MGHAENKRDRLEQTTHMLLTTQEGLRAGEIARYVNCHRSTAQRYLDDIDRAYGLIDMGDGRYRLDPSTYLSEVRLSLSEALSVYLALRRFARQTTHAPNFVISALQKVAPALRHPSLTDQLKQASLELQYDRLASEAHTAVWETMLRGWRENIVIRIDYRKFKNSEPRIHEVEPYLFEPATLSHGTYLIAWSRTRNELRTFKMWRIKRATLTTEKFEKPDNFDFDDLLRTAWGIWYGQGTVKVELLFSATIASRVKETRWHPSQEIIEQEDGSLLWSVEVAATLELLSWVRGWGSEVEVIGPPEFRRQIIEDARKTMQLYEEEEFKEVTQEDGL